MPFLHFVTHLYFYDDMGAPQVGFHLEKEWETSDCLSESKKT